ncbi:MAG: hypothetical protein MJ172_01350 [Clostridia bacterium]|nr:hypothetical protein [Clostridia bacterium]
MYKIKYISLILLINLTAAFLLGGCKTSDDTFPTFTINPTVDDLSSSSSIDEETDDTSSVESVPHIVVSLPYSDTTISYLGKLFYLKQSDNLGSNTTGASINLEYLEGVNAPFIIDSLLSSPTGSNLNTIKNWSDNGGVPDLFLTNDLKGVYENGYICPLDQYVFDNDLLSSVNTFDSVYSCRIGDALFGIPYGFSYDLIFANIDYLPRDFIENYDITSKSYVNVFSDVSTLNSFIIDNFLSGNENSSESETNQLVIFRGAYQLLLNDYSTETYDFVKSWYDNDFASEYDTNNSDPVVSRSAVMWIGNSSEMDFWSDYYPEKLCFFRLPSVNGNYYPYATLYPMCVSSESQFKSFASDFASFIAFDEDALLLINRLENNNGIYPMADYYSVWNNITSDSDFGNIARSIQQLTGDIVFSNNVIDNASYKDLLLEIRESVVIEEEENEQE